MEMVNGYVFLDLTKSNVYVKALKVLGAEKPVIIKDASGVPYFVDSIALDGTNVVITKNGKTITIANDNTITSTGIVSAPTMENIMDLAGHKRFIEFEGEIVTPKTGVTIEYCKASLSGTHLMLVTAGTFDADSYDISGGIDLGNFNLPEWILDKIVGVWGDNFIELKTLRITQDNWTNVNSSAVLRKTDASLTVGVPNSGNPLVIAGKSGFRIQFDLLIDAE